MTCDDATGVLFCHGIEKACSGGAGSGPAGHSSCLLTHSRPERIRTKSSYLIHKLLSQAARSEMAAMLAWSRASLMPGWSRPSASRLRLSPSNVKVVEGHGAG